MKILCDGCGRNIKPPRDGYCSFCGAENSSGRQLVFAPPSIYKFRTEGEREAAGEWQRQSAAFWDLALKS